MLVALGLLLPPGCAKAERAASAPPATATAESAPAPTAAVSRAQAPGSQATANNTNANPNNNAPITRRIIHTGELWLESDTADDTAKRVQALADQKGGFVISSDTQRYASGDGGETTTVTIVLRVPAQTFEATLEALRALGTRVVNEKITGQDVTEEYLDLEARLRAQRAVEEQFLAILKQAKTIHDTLEVQQKLGEIRGEIERAEGRRRYLENQTSLSTITVHLAKTLQGVDVSGPGFGRSVRRAARDLVDGTIGIINGVIRAIGLLLPPLVLLGIPGFFLLRWWVRRRRRG